MTASEQVPGTRTPGTHCDACSLHGVCLTHDLPEETQASLDALLDQPRPLKRGQALVTQGEPFDTLYLVRSGSLKQVARPLGHEAEHVVGFYLPGEAVGLEAIGERTCPASVVALETAFVCALPYGRLRELCQHSTTLNESLLRHMSRELRSEQRQLCLLSGRTAEQRLAGFLLGLSERFHQRGCSRYRFQLAMSRGDIGSHLGLALETVSRVLGRFQRQGLVQVANRELTLLSLEGLHAILEER
ncbi:helix-turn-helix domain-containing protein [Halomonas sp.]|uniref:helix-turn-helix domain-containing protein n=1 Tax=Halomonas sp. TaxID=1486246 RepID=UPI003D09FC3C